MMDTLPKTKNYKGIKKKSSMQSKRVWSVPTKHNTMQVGKDVT